MQNRGLPSQVAVTPDPLFCLPRRKRYPEIRICAHTHTTITYAEGLNSCVIFELINQTLIRLKDGKGMGGSI